MNGSGYSRRHPNSISTRRRGCQETPGMKIQSRLVVIGVLFCLVAVVPRAQAVVPAPDGGYPGGNTAEGQSALLSLTTGGFNTAVGFFSLSGNTSSQFN